MPSKIEKNIPLPADYKVPKRPGKYDLLADMKDRDSVFFADTSRSSVRQACTSFIKEQPEEQRKDYDFHDVETEENGQKGIRLWLNPYAPKQDEKKSEVA